VHQLERRVAAEADAASAESADRGQGGDGSAPLPINVRLGCSSATAIAAALKSWKAAPPHLDDQDAQIWERPGDAGHPRRMRVVVRISSSSIVMLLPPCGVGEI
jgi:hypothetical protein